MPKCVVLRATGSTEDLHHVEDAEVNERTPLRIIDLRSLQDPQNH